MADLLSGGSTNPGGSSNQSKDSLDKVMTKKLPPVEEKEPEESAANRSQYPPMASNAREVKGIRYDYGIFSGVESQNATGMLGQHQTGRVASSPPPLAWPEP